MNKYTIEEVALHDNREDVWIIIHGNVYNVTTFLMEHPGGEEILLDLAGKDGTKCFDNIGHSNEAKLLREKYKIGEVMNHESVTQSEITRPKTIDAGDVETKPKENDYNSQQYQEKTKEKPSQTFTYIIVAICAIIVYYYYVM